MLHLTLRDTFLLLHGCIYLYVLPYQRAITASGLRPSLQGWFFLFKISPLCFSWNLLDFCRLLVDKVIDSGLTRDQDKNILHAIAGYCHTLLDNSTSATSTRLADLRSLKTAIYHRPSKHIDNKQDISMPWQVHKRAAEPPDDHCPK